MPDANTSPVLAQLVQSLIPVVLALSSWAFFALANWARTHAKNEYQRGVADRFSDAVLTIVRSTQQTTVNDIKAATADGRIDPEEARRILDGAVERVKKYVGDNGVKDLEKVFDKQRLEDVIKQKIEATILELKGDPMVPEDEPPKPPDIVVVDSTPAPAAPTEPAPKE